VSGLLCLLFVSQMRADELACGADADPCPPHSRCVPGAGCVSLEQAPQCRCSKDHPCPWSQKCDCKGGCEPIKCTNTAGCGRSLINPRNPCQQMNCSAQHTCQIAPVKCAGGVRCDRLHGCPPETVDASGAKVSERGVVQRETVRAQTDASPGRHNAWVITMIVFMSVLALAWLVFTAYCLWHAWKMMSRKGAI
jgi:hypothetical protein